MHQNAYEAPPLSRNPPPIPDMPEDATAIELARGYASVSAFILHQWPALIATLDRIERKLAEVEPRSSTRITWLLAVVVVAMGTWITMHL